MPLRYAQSFIKCLQEMFIYLLSLAQKKIPAWGGTLNLSICPCGCYVPLQWCHNECDGLSNHWNLDGLLNRLSRCRSKKTSKLCVTGLCEGNIPVTGEFPSHWASNAENVSILWHHHALGNVHFYSNFLSIFPFFWSTCIYSSIYVCINYVCIDSGH